MYFELSFVLFWIFFKAEMLFFSLTIIVTIFIYWWCGFFFCIRHLLKNKVRIMLKKASTVKIVFTNFQVTTHDDAKGYLLKMKNTPSLFSKILNSINLTRRYLIQLFSYTDSENQTEHWNILIICHATLNKVLNKWRRITNTPYQCEYH